MKSASSERRLLPSFFGARERVLAASSLTGRCVHARRASVVERARAPRYKIIGKNGATVRAGESLDSEVIDKVANNDSVLVIEENEAKTRVKIDDPEGWISTKMLMPHSMKQTKEGWKGDIQEYDPGSVSYTHLTLPTKA